jgi:hypothetical protein
MKSLNHKVQDLSQSSYDHETSGLSHPAIRSKQFTLQAEKSAIEAENAALLRLSGDSKGGLGQQLNSVQTNLLRAEAAEVRLRKQAKLQKGKQETILRAFKNLRLILCSFALLSRN